MRCDVCKELNPDGLASGTVMGPFYASAMAHRPDPERLYQAHRSGRASRHMAESRLSPARAEGWISRWGAGAPMRGLERRPGEFWAPAWKSIGHRLGCFGRLRLPPTVQAERSALYT
jgi:hypothetical protein